ncbi:hypothetical protein [Streptomyces sp. NPDC002215]|uniref:hypothetical protein n=1 Tax=Streptomyces sp. NPDC002215 TaxID=3154412 RepID=UPI003326788B
MTKPATVNLAKASPTVFLDKHGVTSGRIKVNLNWTAPQAAAQRRPARPVVCSAGSGRRCARLRPGRWIQTSAA